jgi:hypothetical protein
MHRRILEKIAVRVGVVAPHRKLLHHFVLAELLLFSSAVSGLFDGEGTIPDKSFAASILEHQALLSTRWLQPVVRESLLYLHACSCPLLRVLRALFTAATSSGVANRVERSSDSVCTDFRHKGSRRKQQPCSGEVSELAHSRYKELQLSLRRLSFEVLSNGLLD